MSRILLSWSRHSNAYQYTGSFSVLFGKLYRTSKYVLRGYDDVLDMFILTNHLKHSDIGISFTDLLHWFSRNHKIGIIKYQTPASD